MRFTIFSVAVLCLGLVACDTPTEEEDGGIGTPAAAGLSSLFEPVPVTPGGSAVIPFPNNGLFQGTTDASLNIPNPSNAPFVTAANMTDGFSTTASAFTDFLGFVDFATASAPATAPGLVIFRVTNPNPALWLKLQPGIDYTLQNSPATDASGRTIESQRTRILIEPLRPLAPSSTYMVLVTDNLRDIFGNRARPSEEFVLARDSTTAVSAQNPAVHPILNLLSPAQEAALEGARTGLVVPTVNAVVAAYNGNAAFPVDITPSNVVIAWPFTTQSTSLTLSRLNGAATAKTILVANTTLSTGDLGAGLNDFADIWAGIVSVPYYLRDNSTPGAPLTSASIWENDGTLNDTVFPPLASSGTMCSALNNTPPGGQFFSTNVCRPDPLSRSTQTVPVLVTVPNNNVCAANPGLCGGDATVDKPANGWPVVIFQHGITRNRTDMFALAPTLAAAGFVTVAIDHPLHGITNNCVHNGTTCINPFYRNQLFTGSPAAGLITGERTFDMDFADNTPDAANPCLAANNQPDGTIDSSGNWFINLSSVGTSRDNLRQSVADLIHLTKSMVNLDLNQDPATLAATDIDETRIFLSASRLARSSAPRCWASTPTSARRA